MFLRALLATVLLATPAAADAVEESRKLYDVVAQGAAAFVELVESAADDPAGAGGEIRAQVSRPVSAANADWVGAMAEAGPEAFIPFFPCHTAATSLDGLATDMTSFLEGRTERPDVALDVGYFREDFTRCELALEIEPTFPELVGALSE